MRTSSTGFTLIELLIVIAILGIFSTIVIAALALPRTQGTNAKVRIELREAQNQAEITFSTGDGYSQSCNDATMILILQNAALAGSGSNSDYVCNGDNIGWAASAPLRKIEGESTHWCVDYKNTSVGRAGHIASGVTSC